MKALRIISLLLVLTLVWGMAAGCSRTGGQHEDGRISIVATVFPQYDFARRIAGDKASITLLLKPGMEAHSYEPTPKDILTIATCDLFLNVGGESESWLDTMLEAAGNYTMRRVAAMDCVEVMEEETVEGMLQKGHAHAHSHDEDEEAEHHHDEDEEEAEHHHDGDEEEYDEHVWTSPMNAVAIVQHINQALCEMDPQNADYYSRNTAIYVAELLNLDAAFRDAVLGAKRDVIVFGDRFPLLYFVREYDLTYYAAFPGCASETEPSAATVAFLTDTVKREGIPVIFYIELSNHKVADAIAEATGTRTGLFHTCHNISADDFAAGESYLSLMQANVEALREALS